MPIGLEQWRAQIGLLYASRMPRALVASKGRKYRRRMNWSSLLSFCLALVDILFMRTVTDAVDTEKQVSRKAAGWWKTQLRSSSVFQSLPTHSEGGRKGLSLLMICLMVVQMLLIMSGDVEENPGPLTRQESRLEVGDLAMVQGELVNVASKWRNIGLGLGFNYGILSEIQEHKSDPSSCLQEMLDRWLKTVNPPPTWEALAKALDIPIVGEYRLAQHIAALKEAPQYVESVQQASERGQSAATEEEGQGREVIEQLERLNLKEQLLEKDITIATEQRVIQGLRQQIQFQNVQLQEMQRAVQEKERVIEARERQLRELNQQLQFNEQVTAEFKQNLLQKEREVKDLEKRLAAKEVENQELQQQQSSRRSDVESNKLTWRESGKAPNTMYRGADAVEGSVAYFIPNDSKEVHTYDSEKEEWSQLPDCPLSDFSLAVVKGLVTTIGGQDSAGGRYTNTLHSLTGQGRDRRWTEHFPSMPTNRGLTTAACDGKNLIVAGGQSDSGVVSIVEVMDTENLKSVKWYTAASLPHPLFYATATICGDKLYLLGGNDQNVVTKSVLTCSLTDLLQSCQSQSWLRRTRKPTLNIWHTVADIPVYGSSCTILRGELVAVGGHKSDYKKKTNAVYQYSPSTDSWQVISHMKTARSDCLVAAFPNNKLIVVGGCTDGQITDMVEIAML